ncbi:unnamed protein product [Urochloa humidicola]
MDYSMQGSKDAYSPQVHNLYPHAQPELYPPPPPPPAAANPQGAYQYQYQGYMGGTEHPAYGDHAYAGSPLHYQDDADCITFLRGCLAGLCCCWFLGRCCV